MNQAFPDLVQAIRRISQSDSLVELRNEAQVKLTMELLKGNCHFNALTESRQHQNEDVESDISDVDFI